jgi:tRNA-splicing ligase RtcB
VREIFDSPQRVPICCWAAEIDPLSLERLKMLARWGRLAGPIAVMPDIHFAGDVCVGTVLATDRCVLPTAIGEDLGCGMCSRSFELDAREFGRHDLERIVERIGERIPTGRRVHRQAQAMDQPLLEAALSTHSLSHQRDWLGTRHIGTLGGGNHFIELQHDPLWRLWVTVHSGSRGIGAAIASHHAKVTATRRNPSDLLPVIELETKEATNFFNDLGWALKFAAANRRRMMEEVVKVVDESSGRSIESTELFDVAHNLIGVESHGGRTLVVHRKGAMPAGAASRGIIPGSMGTASYIVDGLSHCGSYASCSHGAGRRLTRGEAHRKISRNELRRQMARVVYPRQIEEALIEEAPAAYKDIRDVLDQQRELVRPVLRLEPLAVVKGK